MMTNKLKGAIAVGVVAALAAGGAAIAGAAGGGDDGSGTPITGSALDKAKAAALQHTGGGEVSATEVRDEEGYYEVEVKKNDGSQVDVHLDRNFNLLDSSADGGSADSGAN
jgi:peptidase YpeB-like protein